jgi:large subunit ribosomal protein L4
MKIAVFSQSGQKEEEKDFKLAILDEPVNLALVHEAIVIQLSNRRLASAKTKIRAEVAGGGRKPHRQKGTGRARSGSIRNPLWRGGGVIFGPTGEQNFNKNLPKKKKRAAIVSSLAAKKADIVQIESIKAEKTKDFAKIAEKLVGQAKALFVFPNLAEKEVLASRNLSNIKVCDYRNINVFNLLAAKRIIFVGDALEKTDEFWRK